ncbi:hypothetical protein CBE01nite_43100 [Clostridium beijerinckii]|uniref:Uncharacterized protein n=1 Tax=Clostridium beijerinckii TaxID=1520 RepID=A0AB74VH26_CLOBE|nr:MULTISPECIES: hypothetical protein [Clostridium]NRZ24835.1 hypothetical protein [Clostridium beijerinckii]NYB98951.1 hypothetical protein [Clostridium beijerinckii]OOM24985.1 hypothetical protein CLBEI_18360 [Clostridium beijerinckii]QUN35640.1 hypothetical protein KEC93_02040 [Clostridium beijerinckii]SQB21999.1 Uncharacterised protein [Clostridium beijerinckii]
MKKFTILFLIFLCLFFNIIGLKSTFAVSGTFKQGIYNLSDFNISSGNIYSVSNISKTDSVRVFIFDKDYIPIQDIKLDPGSLNVDTIPMTSEYIFVVTGGGEVTITPKSP